MEPAEPVYPSAIRQSIQRKLENVVGEGEREGEREATHDKSQP